ncbi:hypothetical protein KNP414_01418 [Paenibacillus mucilaginosus KNP414]|uniref:Uncharacterized protein n=1 Tax=Paenibacillus mucilaginosus (strain KNP414) TaxID=1036673 RepID=F8FL63_PAEMK|nr:hypothetical protein KNP414_01418 [Paenibacillus mucilaginosus KNP414]
MRTSKTTVLPACAEEGRFFAAQIFLDWNIPIKVYLLHKRIT